jgi:NAD(P)-dependent dehydrogenase (short-subunit alcohol dehydrogenase family)
VKLVFAVTQFLPQAAHLSRLSSQISRVYHNSGNHPEIPQMVKQGKGAIVNTSSVAGLVAAGGGINAYGPSKAGVVQLTRDAALAYAKTGIRVNAVCPGVIKTEMIRRVIEEYPSMKDYLANRAPMGRLGEPNEIAQVVVWLCSDESSFITGVALPVDGGWTAQ